MELYLRMTIEVLYTHIHQVYIDTFKSDYFFFLGRSGRGTGQGKKKLKRLKRLKRLREELQQWTTETHCVA
jgi:hypothetical protein